MCKLGAVPVSVLTLVLLFLLNGIKNNYTAAKRPYPVKKF
jgi:hypothetical protein